MLGHIDRGVREHLATGAELERLRELARALPSFDLDPRQVSDAGMLGVGALAPLQGFMGAADYAAVLASGRLQGGQPFTIPVVLRVHDDDVERLRGASQVALRSAGKPIAILEVADIFRTDPAVEAANVYGTDDVAHPGVHLLQSGGRWAIGGPVTALARPSTGFDEYDLTPLEVRRLIAERGWRTTVGFQTRNPVHRAHEYLQKVALENIDGLLLHPLVGETKSDDIPADVRMACYEALLDGLLPQAARPARHQPGVDAVRGPQGGGVPRPDPAQLRLHPLHRRPRPRRAWAATTTPTPPIASSTSTGPDELGIEILRFEHAFYCRACGGMASTRTCPHPSSEHAVLSGTRVRELLARGEPLPVEFSRPEVAELLREATKNVA